MEKESKDVMGLHVENESIEGNVLLIDLSSVDREALTTNGRRAALEYASAKYPAWANAGVEKASSPIAFDPNDKDNNPFSPKDASVKWHFRQTIRLTRSPI